jgi:hypothetical protein
VLITSVELQVAVALWNQVAVLIWNQRDFTGENATTAVNNCLVQILTVVVAFKHPDGVENQANAFDNISRSITKVVSIFRVGNLNLRGSIVRDHFGKSCCINNINIIKKINFLYKMKPKSQSTM